MTFSAPVFFLEIVYGNIPFHYLFVTEVESKVILLLRSILNEVFCLPNENVGDEVIIIMSTVCVYTIVVWQSYTV